MSNSREDRPVGPGPLGLLWGVVARPRRALSTIVAECRRSWWIPAALILVLSLGYVLSTGPIRTRQTREAMEAAQEQMAERMGEQLSAEDLERAQSITASPLITVVFPAASSLIGRVVGWLIWAGALYLASMALGGRSEFRQIFPVTVWAGLPYALRSVVQTIYVLGTGRLITNPGLSGLLQRTSPDSAAEAIASSPGTGQLVLTALLARVDVFLVWHLILLVIAVGAASQLSKRKSVLVTLGVWAVLTLLSLIPSLVAGLFSASQMAM